MADNSPAFQYYPADLLSDPEVMFWDMEAIGCYWQLITFLWLNGGKFEFNLENLCKLFRVNRQKTAEKLWKKIEKKFVFQNGIVTHKRVIKEMQKQKESRLKRQEAGKKGAESRWGNDSNANSNAIEKDMAKNGSSSSTSTSVNNIHTNNGGDFTLQQVKDAAIMVGLTPDKAEMFFHHFNAQGWVRTNGQKITNLASALTYWRNHQFEFEKGNSNDTKKRTNGNRPSLNEQDWGQDLIPN